MCETYKASTSTMIYGYLRSHKWKFHIWNLYQGFIN